MSLQGLVGASSAARSALSYNCIWDIHKNMLTCWLNMFILRAPLTINERSQTLMSSLTRKPKAGKFLITKTGEQRKCQEQKPSSLEYPYRESKLKTCKHRLQLYCRPRCPGWEKWSASSTTSTYPPCRLQARTHIQCHFRGSLSKVTVPTRICRTGRYAIQLLFQALWTYNTFTSYLKKWTLKLSSICDTMTTFDKNL